MFSNFIQHLTRILQTPAAIPGSEIQFEMAPAIRKKLMSTVNEGSAIKSAVLMLLYPYKNTIYTVFMQRPDEIGLHSGQISFPGGKVEDIDKSLIDTAIRETHEEIGVNPTEVVSICQLTDLYIPVSNFVVTPVVAYIKQRPVFVPNAREVKFVIEAPLSELLLPETKKMKRFTQREFEFDAPVFNINGHIIWGATAMMLNELLYILKRNKLEVWL